MASAENGQRTVAAINLRALRANYRALGIYANGAKIMAVVKADAYGHGAVAVARTLRDEGCAHFGIATVAEARELRNAGIDQRLYLLGGFFAEQADEIISLNLTPPVFDVSLIDPLERAAERARRRDYLVHLKLDTGATRLGIPPGDLGRAIELMRTCRALRFEGAFTLLASAADPSRRLL